MPEERIIPAVHSVAEFIISVNGLEIPRSVPKLAVSVQKIVNKVSTAVITLQDGEASNGLFPLTDGDLFKPGNKVSISAGDPDNTTAIFDGIIIKQSLKIRNNAAPHLILECKHRAISTTIGRKSACFHDITDADIITKILTDGGFAATGIDVEDTKVNHKEMVQYNCTDWDFIVSRAEVNGKVVTTNDEGIVIKKPVVSDDVSLNLLHGATILELDAEMDSRNQYSSVVSRSWDMDNLEVAETSAAEPQELTEHGNMQATELASVAGPQQYVIQHAGAIPPDERQGWADAALLKSRLSKIRGRVKFQGIATINAGDIVGLAGLGERFNGNAFVSGVMHEFTLSSGWKTHAQFGYANSWFTEDNKVEAPKASGMLPGVTGLATGIVTDNVDPEGNQRVKIKISGVSDNVDGVWARMALADAGDDRGLFFRPEVGDEVVLGFLNDDPRLPIILGMLHSSKLPPPITPTDDNFKKGYTSREKLKMTFDDELKEIQFETPASNKVFITDDKKGFRVEDQNGNKITTDPSEIKITDSNGNSVLIDISPGIIKIKANNKVVVDAPQIELVEGAGHPLVFGDELLNYLNQIVNIYQTHMHPGQLALGALPVTPAPPIPPMPPATPALLSLKVKTG
ncbi:type VI secretion system tip protein VgrG [Mucilaginibacter sp. JRF]|uniref:type VI secretion system tip protein VgrG n=1 Tax=Mucilaginibacter sp. JRF TaxID=2780088 RepID=UPI0018815DD8|nr:type VI secretion system tip protein VgrG [Mucilaginibacter sp. JRF]MBE9586609.1 type VI secretion system tip protein VgrG [Mucilaginibacter sp. JRF]